MQTDRGPSVCFHDYFPPGRSGVPRTVSGAHYLTKSYMYWRAMLAAFLLPDRRSIRDTARFAGRGFAPGLGGEHCLDPVAIDAAQQAAAELQRCLSASRHEGACIGGGIPGHE